LRPSSFNEVVIRSSLIGSCLLAVDGASDAYACYSFQIQIGMRYP
jgi:hypothetical protein